MRQPLQVLKYAISQFQRVIDRPRTTVLLTPKALSNARAQPALPPSSWIRRSAVFPPVARVLGAEPGWLYPSIVVPEQVIAGSDENAEMKWGPAPGMLNVIVWGPAPQLALAYWMAARSEPAPESAVVVT